MGVESTLPETRCQRRLSRAVSWCAMPLKKLASSSAHNILSKLIDLGLVPDQTVTAVERSEEHGVQVVVHITKYDGPLKLHLSAEGYRILGLSPPAFVAPSPSPPASHPGPAPLPAGADMPPRWRKILAVLKGQPPRKGEWIAAKCRRAYSGSVRADLSDLLKCGRLRRNADGGYELPGTT